MLERQRVGDGRDLFRIAAKHIDAGARLPGRVPLAEQVVGALARSMGRCPCSSASNGSRL